MLPESMIPRQETNGGVHIIQASGGEECREDDRDIEGDVGRHVYMDEEGIDLVIED